MLLISGLLLLALLWGGPLPVLAGHSFSAHMLLHIAVVAVAAPLIAGGVIGTRLDGARRWPRAFPAMVASMFELAVVWGWHLPALHQAARADVRLLTVEQATFLGSGLWLWLSAFGGGQSEKWRAGTGVAALLFTSIHMTLLGALFALAPRTLYAHGHTNSHVSSSTLIDPATLTDQHIGGAIMLLVGGASYLAGGLWLAAQMLEPHVRKERRG